MSDAILRALERTRTDDDPRLWRERMRSGLLNRDRWIMAARLGDELALMVTDETDEIGWSWAERKEAVSLLSHVEIVRVACDWAEFMPQKDEGLAAIAAARAWADCPCEKHRVAAAYAAASAYASAYASAPASAPASAVAAAAAFAYSYAYAYASDDQRARLALYLTGRI